MERGEKAPAQMPKTNQQHTNADVPAQTEVPSSFSFGPSSRACAGSCGQVIPQARLLAHPNARLCVPCQVAVGDVAVIRRFDEFSADGSKLETYFTAATPLIARQLLRSNVVVPDDLSFDLAVGDDSHLVREGNRVMDVARPLSTEFEPDAPWEDVEGNILVPLVA